MLFEQIKNDVKTAMKEKDQERLSTLRMLQSALKNASIDLGKELEEADVTKVVKQQIKALKDSLQAFKDGGRDDLAEGVEKELSFLEPYMPEELPDGAIDEIVKAVIAEVGASSKADMGKVMGPAMARVAGQADGSRVKASVEKHLS